jgi:hypothetical protein
MFNQPTKQTKKQTNTQFITPKGFSILSQKVL